MTPGRSISTPDAGQEQLIYQSEDKKVLSNEGMYSIVVSKNSDTGSLNIWATSTPTNNVIKSGTTLRKCVLVVSYQNPDGLELKKFPQILFFYAQLTIEPSRFNCPTLTNVLLAYCYRNCSIFKDTNDQLWFTRFYGQDKIPPNPPGVQLISRLTLRGLSKQSTPIEIPIHPSPQLSIGLFEDGDSTHTENASNVLLSPNSGTQFSLQTPIQPSIQSYPSFSASPNTPNDQTSSKTGSPECFTQNDYSYSTPKFTLNPSYFVPETRTEYPNTQASNFGTILNPVHSHFNEPEHSNDSYYNSSRKTSTEPYNSFGDYVSSLSVPKNENSYSQRVYDLSNHASSNYFYELPSHLADMSNEPTYPPNEHPYNANSFISSNNSNLINPEIFDSNKLINPIKNNRLEIPLLYSEAPRLTSSLSCPDPDYQSYDLTNTDYDYPFSSEQTLQDYSLVDPLIHLSKDPISCKEDFTSAFTNQSTNAEPMESSFHDQNSYEEYHSDYHQSLPGDFNFKLEQFIPKSTPYIGFNHHSSRNRYNKSNSIYHNRRLVTSPSYLFEPEYQFDNPDTLPVSSQYTRSSSSNLNLFNNPLNTSKYDNFNNQSFYMSLPVENTSFENNDSALLNNYHLYQQSNPDSSNFKRDVSNPFSIGLSLI